MLKITVNGETKEYEIGTTYGEVAKDFEDKFDAPIALAMKDYKLNELFKVIKEDGEISFITTKEKPGISAYRRTLIFVLMLAVKRLYGEKGVRAHILHTIGNGQYVELEGLKEITDDVIKEIENEMRKITDASLKISKSAYSKDDALKLFEENNMTGKRKLFTYRRNSTVNIYEMDGYKNYFYGAMLPSTEYVENFGLAKYQKGFVLLYPDAKTGEVSSLRVSDKLFATQRGSELWGESLGIKNVGELDAAIVEGRIQDIILMAEAEMEGRIAELAGKIVEAGSKKFIMIAGPSSSGKTSFSHRLSIQLRARGLKPHPIPLDNYYKNRSETPRDENGNYDFECLEALDVELFNKDMTALLNGETVNLPIFNFKTGAREYRDNYMKLEEGDILVIEGIHGLNDKLSYSLPKESKYKIYISALTQLAIDNHNALSTTDGRLMRRIVRDSRTRGTSARDTIAMWPSVRRGEENYIFPFQEEADYVFNSALIYEIAVLKVYIEPELFAIPKDCPEYLEANRLLKFLDYFISVPSENIHRNSLVREFIGGSCFNV